MDVPVVNPVQVAPTATYAGIDVDLTRLSSERGDPDPLFRGLASLLVRTVSRDARDEVVALVGGDPSAPIDVLVGGASGVGQVVQDADRQTSDDIDVAVRGALAGARAPRERRSEALILAVTCSGMADLTFLTGPVGQDVALHVDIGRPERRPVVRVDASGTEVIVIRTIAPLAVRIDGPCGRAHLSSVLARIRTAIEAA